MLYKVRLNLFNTPDQDVIFQHPSEVRREVYEAGFSKISLWVSFDHGATWEHMSNHAIQAVFISGFDG